MHLDPHKGKNKVKKRGKVNVIYNIITIKFYSYIAMHHFRPPSLFSSNIACVVISISRVRK